MLVISGTVSRYLTYTCQSIIIHLVQFLGPFCQYEWYIGMSSVEKYYANCMSSYHWKFCDTEATSSAWHEYSILILEKFYLLSKSLICTFHYMAIVFLCVCTCKA